MLCSPWTFVMTYDEFHRIKWNQTNTVGKLGTSPSVSDHRKHSQCENQLSVTFNSSQSPDSLSKASLLSVSLLLDYEPNLAYSGIDTCSGHIYISTLFFTDFLFRWRNMLQYELLRFSRTPHLSTATQRWEIESQWRTWQSFMTQLILNKTINKYKKQNLNHRPESVNKSPP